MHVVAERKQGPVPLAEAPNKPQQFLVGSVWLSKTTSRGHKTGPAVATRSQWRACPIGSAAALAPIAQCCLLGMAAPSAVARSGVGGGQRARLSFAFKEVRVALTYWMEPFELALGIPSTVRSCSIFLCDETIQTTRQQSLRRASAEEPGIDRGELWHCIVAPQVLCSQCAAVVQGLRRASTQRQPLGSVACVPGMG